MYRTDSIACGPLQGQPLSKINAELQDEAVCSESEAKCKTMKLMIVVQEEYGGHL